MQVRVRAWVLQRLNPKFPPGLLGRSHPLLVWSDTEDTRQLLHLYWGKTMEGAYGEWTYIGRHSPASSQNPHPANFAAQDPRGRPPGRKLEMWGRQPKDFGLGIPIKGKGKSM